MARIETHLFLPASMENGKRATIPATTASYQFTPSQDWFSHNIPTWGPFIDELRSTINHPPRALEIGSWEGRSAVYLLTKLCNSSSSELVCIDHFDLFGTHDGSARFAKLQHNLSIPGSPFRIIDDFSVPGLFLLLDEELASPTGGFDFVYIDGSHKADDTLLDAELAWRLTRQGALVIFDDYEWSDEPPDSMSHPRRGIDAFLALHTGDYELLHKGYQVILRKTAEMRIGFLTKKGAREVNHEKLEYGINIVMCTDSAYAMPTAVTIQSAIDATADKRMTFYVVDCGLSEEDKGMIRETSSMSNRVTLQFIQLPDGSKGRQDPTWAKIDALSLLPVERALFLDSDILVRKDLGDLWKVDLQGKMLAAARDIGHPLGHNGVERGPYFNAGMMLLDMARIRTQLPLLIELTKSRAETTLKDQDVLNTFFRGGWLEVGLEWNATGLGTYARMHSEDRAAMWPRGELEGVHRNPRIVHFSGPMHPTMASVLNEYVQPWISKPWGYAGAPGHPFAEEWWDALKKTAWKYWPRSEERKMQQREAEKKALDVGDPFIRLIR